MSVRVCTIGHAGHGKSTLTAAITTVLARRIAGAVLTVDDVVSSPRVEYATAARSYTHTDGPSDAAYATSDGAILVVSAADGPMPQTREHIQRCSQAAVPSIVVFLNLCDIVGDEELLATIEMQVRELLTEYGFPGAETSLVRGAAQKALEGETQWEDKIMELTGHLDNSIQTRD